MSTYHYNDGMIILGIETSCDETALCVLETKNEEGRLKFKVRNNSVLSQIKLHAQYGGVFPMMAKREHAKNLVPLLEKTFEAAFVGAKTSPVERTPQLEGLLAREPELLTKLCDSTLGTNPGIDAIAVTHGPGLEPALWVGINFAKALSTLWNVPVVPINHMEGHVLASLLDERSHRDYFELKRPEFPAISLLISGGHTELVRMRDFHDYEVVGKTRDDAVGEAFDKVARILGLPYPGGPQISTLAQKAREAEIPALLALPRPMLHSKDLDFSFSGLKTAVLYAVKKMGALTDDQKAAMSREFEDATRDVLIAKTKSAIEEHGARSLIIGGGVIANLHLRTAFESLAKAEGVPLFIPQGSLSTDNALMIALAGALHAHKGFDVPHAEIHAQGNLSLNEPK